MINIMYAVDPIKRIVKPMSGHAVTEQDHEASSLRFAFPDNIAGTGIDSTGTAVRVMYIRPDGGEPVAKTLTFYKHSGGYYLYDWNLQKSDLQKEGSLVFSLCILNIAEGKVEEWHTTPCAVRVLSTIHTDDSDEGDESITPTVAQRVAILESMIQRVASGAPIVVSSASAMTDTNQIYVLSTNGRWYYHNGSAWVAGGEYGAVATDRTLTQENIPADAEAVGNELGNINSTLTNRTAGVLDVIDSMSDLDVVDPSGNVILRLADGEIITKNFDSAAINRVLDEESDNADLDISDVYGNVIARFKDGGFLTKNFKGFQYITFVSEAKVYNGQQLTLTLNATFNRGDRVIIHMERGAMPWDGGGTISYYEGNNLIVDSSRVDCAWIEHTVMQDGATIRAVYPANSTGMANGPVRLEVSLLGDVPVTPNVVTVKQDGSGDYTTLRAALDAIGTSANDVLNPYRVEIYPGTYDVMDDYTDEEIADAEYDITKFVGPLLLNGVYLIGMGENPSEVILNGVLDTEKWDSAIRGVVSTLNCQGSCGFENMTVLATNLRYCVHDDYYTQVGKPYKRIVKNCVFRAYGQMSYTTPLTYGAGMKRMGANFYFENCDFGSCSGIHTDRVMFRQGFVHLVNCKGTQFEAGDIEESENTEKTIYRLDNCCFDQFWQHYWGEQQYTHAHVELCGTAKGMIYTVPSFALYKTGDISMCPNLALVPGTVVEQWVQYYRPRWRTATSIKTAEGIVIGMDGTDCYIQSSGYVPTNLIGISSFSVGDYVGMVNGKAAVVQSADDAIGIILVKDSDGVGHIKLHWR